MVYPLTYRRPKYMAGSSSSDSSTDSDTDRRDSCNNSKKDSSLRSGNSGIINGIPEALSFDRIISGGTCPPMTIRDFMNYACYIEHNSENLRFFLWYKDFCKRFEETSKSETALSPEWTQAQQEATLQDITSQAKLAAKSNRGVAKELFKGTDFAKQNDLRKRPEKSEKDPFTTPPRTPQDNAAYRSTAALPWEKTDSEETSYYSSWRAESCKKAVSDAFDSVGVEQPFTIQPFREEIDRILSIYIIRNFAPRELNISDKQYIAFFHAYQTTTHPSIFRNIISTVESSLRYQSHPNFVRWSICNGNPARVWFARGLGVSTITLGLVAALLLTLSSAPRGYRALAAILWFIGISTLIAAYKGMCVVLHGLHHRHLRPWELFNDEEPESATKNSFDTLSTTVSYEDEPWVVKYEKRNIIRKIFDRELWIQEPALRQIQDTIFVQSLLGAVLFTAVLTAIFVPLPKGRFF